MRAFSVVFFLAIILSPACAHRRSSLEMPQVSTAPPPHDCTSVGRASGSATEPTAAMALSRARDNLASEGDRLGGTYVQITGQDVTPVEMAVTVVEVRLEGRVYRCAGADAGDDEGAPTAAAASAGSVTAADGSNGMCMAPAERQELGAGEGPGWQCARRVAEGWVAEGAYVVYWPNGATKIEGSFDHGKRSGRWSFYYQNGQLREQATFRDGQREGCAARFDIDGNTEPSVCPNDAGLPADAQ